MNKILKKSMLAIALFVAAASSTEPFLTDAAPTKPEKINGSTIYFFQTDATFKADKTIELSLKDIRILKSESVKKDFARTVSGSKNPLLVSLKTLLLETKTASLYVKTPESADDFVVQTIIDAKKVRAVAVYSHKELEPWAMLSIKACMQIQPKLSVWTQVLVGIAGFSFSQLLLNPKLRTTIKDKCSQVFSPKKSPYNVGGRMYGFGKLLTETLANKLRLHKSEVCFKSTGAYDSTGKFNLRADLTDLTIDNTADLVVVEVYSKGLLSKLSHIWNEESDANLKVILFPFSAFNQDEYVSFAQTFKDHHWTIAVVDDGSIIIPTNKPGDINIFPELAQPFHKLMDDTINYTLLVNPKDGGPLNVWTKKSAKLMCGAVDLHDDLLQGSFARAAHLAQFLLPFAMRSDIAVELATQLDETKQPDEILVLQTMADIAQVSSSDTALQPEPTLRPQDLPKSRRGEKTGHNLAAHTYESATKEVAVLRFAADSPNPLNSYDFVVASCMKMSTWDEISTFITLLCKIPKTEDPIHDELSDDHKFEEAQTDHVDTDGQKMVGFAESQHEFDNPTRESVTLDVDSDQLRILLLPSELVRNKKNLFFRVILDITKNGWKIVLIEDGEPTAGSYSFKENQWPSYTQFIHLSLPSADKVTAIAEIAGHIKTLSYSGSNWIDIVRAWALNPYSIFTNTPEGTPALKQPDGSEVFIPYEHPHRRAVEQDYKPAAKDVFSFGRLESLTLPECENPFAQYKHVPALFNAFTDPFIEKIKSLGAWRIMQNKEAEAGSSKINEAQNIIIKVASESDKVNVAQMMAEVQRTTYPANQGRYLVVPASMIDNLLVDQLAFDVTEKIKCVITGLLNEGNWKLVIVDDTQMSQFSVIQEGVIPLIKGFLDYVYNYSIVSHNRSNWYGLITKNTKPSSLIEKRDFSKDMLIQAIIDHPIA